jgi:hypothetical protein
MKQKIHTISGLMNMGDMAYQTQAGQLDTLKSQLLADVNRQRILTQNVHHQRALKCEQVRLLKALVLEKGKERALEDELEKPLNVHRWRFIEATNPHLSQLLKMNLELRDRLMLKLTVLHRLKQAKHSLKKKADLLDVHLMRGYSGNINDEFEFLNGVLRQKSRQLVAIEGQVLGQTDSVVEHKGQIRTIRCMVREEKGEYYDTKQKMNTIRSPTALGRSRIKASGDDNESRFIGGGFAVAGVVRNQLLLSPTQKRSALQSPQIVHPKSVSMLQRKLPNGWSQNRVPLQPVLPIVSSP